MASNRIGQPGRKCAECGGQCADEAIAGKQGGSGVTRRGFGEPRMLEREKQADIAGTRVQRADERNDELRPNR